LEEERMMDNMGLDSQQKIEQQKKSRHVRMVEDVTVEDESLKLPAQKNSQRNSENVRFLGSASNGSSNNSSLRNKISASMSSSRRQAGTPCRLASIESNDSIVL
jgi:hypothetical protein